MRIFKLKTVNKIVVEVLARFHQAHCLRQAGDLAYTTLLTIVPVLSIGFFVLTLFPVFQNLTQTLEVIVFKFFVPSAAQGVQQYLNVCIGQAQHLPILGVIALFGTAILLIISVENVFNDIWGLKSARSRRGFIAFFGHIVMYMAALLLLPLFVGVIYAICLYLGQFSLEEMSLTHRILILSAPHIAIFLAFALLYAFLPNSKVSFAAAVTGSLVATFLLELAKQGFAVYIAYFANYKFIYGALSLIPIFLVWLYVFWVILLFGVVVSYVVTKVYKKNTVSSLD